MISKKIVHVCMNCSASTIIWTESRGQLKHRTRFLASGNTLYPTNIPDRLFYICKKCKENRRGKHKTYTLG